MFYWCVVSLFSTLAEGLSWSYRWRSIEQRPCFYFNMEEANLKANFYFSVMDSKNEGVKSLVDATIYGPNNQVLHSVKGKSHTEFPISSGMTGEHSMCLNLTEDSPPGVERNVDLDLTMYRPDGSVYVPRAAKTHLQAGKEGENEKEEEDTSGMVARLEAAVGKLQKDLSDLVHSLRYLKGREQRNQKTTETIFSRLFYITLFESALILGMSIMQVTILRNLFATPKNKARV